MGKSVTWSGSSRSFLISASLSSHLKLLQVNRIEIKQRVTWTCKMRCKLNVNEREVSQFFALTLEFWALQCDDHGKIPSLIDTSSESASTLFLNISQLIHENFNRNRNSSKCASCELFLFCYFLTFSWNFFDQQF
jgi:hypothetical protein